MKTKTFKAGLKALKILSQFIDCVDEQPVFLNVEKEDEYQPQNDAEKAFIKTVKKAYKLVAKIGSNKQFVPSTHKNEDLYAQLWLTWKKDKNGDTLWGYKNFLGEWVIQPTYKWARKFQYGFAIVSNEHFFGVIDIYGGIIVPLEYKSVYLHIINEVPHVMCQHTNGITHIYNMAKFQRVKILEKENLGYRNFLDPDIAISGGYNVNTSDVFEYLDLDLPLIKASTPHEKEKVLRGLVKYDGTIIQECNCVALKPEWRDGKLFAICTQSDGEKKEIFIK